MRTTINIHIGIFAHLDRAAKRNGIPVSDLIGQLLNRVMADKDTRPCRGRPVAYQARNARPAWRILHLNVKDDVYECWLDLRKVLKMSVSLIVAVAVERYIVSAAPGTRADNYPHQNYLMIKEYRGTVIEWRFIWGIPPGNGHKS